jgi:CrcB protein
MLGAAGCDPGEIDAASTRFLPNMLTSLPLRSLILVGVGAIPGAWLRFRFVNHLEPLVPQKHWATFGVNLIACFGLGLIVASTPGCAPSQTLPLLVATGFFGSMSTFSTLMVELLQAAETGSRFDVLLLAGGSVVAGLVALAAGLGLGGQR